ncbi:MAG: hypothetical protein U5Q44_09985 [Dehalococcoidia bacterium]|nr:hypothetical protein [Dehalococcoidia bacterium]
MSYPSRATMTPIRAIELILGKMADAAIEGRAARESGAGAGAHAEELAELAAQAEAGLESGTYSASPEETEPAGSGGTSVSVVSTEEQTRTAQE